MEIGFYEEFPSKSNLKKLELIKFPTRIFIAAKSLSEFREYEKIAKNNKKDLEVGYWPTIPNSYWISPFSNMSDLKELFVELEKIENPLLIDLEFPLKNKSIFLKNSLSFFKNKRLIRRFLEENKGRITTAEYIRSPFSWGTKFLGLDYDIQTEKSLMFYSSTIDKETTQIWRNKISQIEDKTNYSISLGTIATGILGNEEPLFPENLEGDLEFVENAKFKKVIIFRLGGLNKKYISVLEKFI